jgi:hypothetical protein
MISLRYHQQAFNLLGIFPEIDADAEQALMTLEARLGHKLPAAMREWYSIKNARQYLRCNDDYVLPIEKLGGDNNLPENMLFLIDENQSCAAWALLLDSSDNPPVYVANDDYDRWELCAETFSDFVWARVWDWTRYPNEHRLIMWDDAAFAVEMLAYLRQHAEELPASYNGFWRLVPDQTIYRFQQEERRIRIYVQSEAAGCTLIFQDWVLLFQYLRMLRPNVQIRQSIRRRPTTYYVGELTQERKEIESLPF